MQTRGEKRKRACRTFIFFPECSLSYPKNQHLVIVLPESSEELPIRIVSGSRSMELRLCLCPPDGVERHVNETCPERKYVFIWRQNDYLKAAVDEIQWIEAAGSYSRIHLTGGRSLVISFNLASVRRKLPKADRILVLCSDHVNDLLETEQKFKEHYNINQTEGKIASLYGFDIYEYDGTPYYNTSTNAKLAWGATPSSATDRQCSVFYYNGRMMKANGSVQFYHSEAGKDPLYHRNLVNFRKWGICMPLTEKNSVGAIVSAAVKAS